MTSGEITAIVGAITAPVLAYFKIQNDRKQTGQERDMAFALLQQEVNSLREVVKAEATKISTLEITCNEIRVTLSKIDTILTFFKAHMDAEDRA